MNSDRLPYSIKILLESAIWNCDEFQVSGKDVEKIIDWENSAPKQVEIPFKPARVLLQDLKQRLPSCLQYLWCRWLKLGILLPCHFYLYLECRGAGVYTPEPQLSAERTVRTVYQSYSRTLFHLVLMDVRADLRDLFRITFKFGGYWVQVKNEERRRHESGKQMTVTFEKDLVCFFVLKERVETICPWLKGHEFKMYYHIFGTSPKEYMYIASDLEVMRMIAEHHLSGRVEIVITLQEDRENVMSSQIKETTIVTDHMESYYSNLSNFQLSNNEFLLGQQSWKQTGNIFLDSS